LAPVNSVETHTSLCQFGFWSFNPSDVKIKQSLPLFTHLDADVVRFSAAAFYLLSVFCSTFPHFGSNPFRFQLVLPDCPPLNNPLFLLCHGVLHISNFFQRAKICVHSFETFYPSFSGLDVLLFALGVGGNCAFPQSFFCQSFICPPSPRLACARLLLPPSPSRKPVFFFPPVTYAFKSSCSAVSL